MYLRKLTFEQAGAAKAANDLALYAYLVSLHLGYGQPAIAAQAVTLADLILLGSGPRWISRKWQATAPSWDNSARTAG